MALCMDFWLYLGAGGTVPGCNQKSIHRAKRPPNIRGEAFLTMLVRDVVCAKSLTIDAHRVLGVQAHDGFVVLI